MWGADPLEALGSFHSLQLEENDSFRSPLNINGTVSLQRIASECTNTNVSSSVKFAVSFPEVDWTSLRSAYGWAAFQYQGWARGHLDVRGSSSSRVVLFTDNILEVWVNEVHIFGGDFYSFRRAPLVVTLSPGKNVIDIRLVREIRSMGGADSSLKVGLEARLSTNSLHILESTAVLPDLVDGKLPSTFASVTVRNEGGNWLELCDCHLAEVPYHPNLSNGI